MKRYAILLLLLMTSVLAFASHRTVSHPEYGFSAQFPMREAIETDTTNGVVTFSYDDYPTWHRLQVMVYPGVDYAKIIAKHGDIKTFMTASMTENDSDTKMDASGISWSKDDAGHLQATATYTITGKHKDGTPMTTRWTQRMIAVPETGYMYQLNMYVDAADEAAPFDNRDFFDNFKLVK
jgi:hypothetical protein